MSKPRSSLRAVVLASVMPVFCLISLFMPGAAAAHVETVVEARWGNGFRNPNSVSVNPTDNSCWVADHQSNEVVHLGADGIELWRGGGFNYPLSVSVDPADNSCWVADTYSSQVVHLGVDGTELWRGGSFFYPQSVSANPTDGSCWVADTGNSQVVRLGPDGTELWRASGFGDPHSVSVNPADGSCWVADSVNNQVVHLGVDGTELWRGGGFLYPYTVSVNPADGSCWVADLQNSQVVHLGADGTELWRGGELYGPGSVSANPADGSCWVADTNNNQVVHLGADGTELWRGGGFSYPYSISVNPADNSCWVADTQNQQVVHLGADGAELWRGGAFNHPSSVSADPTGDSSWVADTRNSQVVHLRADGTEVWRGGGFRLPMSVSVNPVDDSSWVADTGNNQVVHLGADGTELWRGEGFYEPYSVSVNPADGSCWVADSIHNQVVHLGVEGAELWRGEGFYYPQSVAVNLSDGSCWVADTSNNQVVHLGADGTEVWRGSGFSSPYSISVNPADNSCWVADTYNNQVVHLGSDGSELWRGGGFNQPVSVSVSPADGSCWVADSGNNQVVHLAADGTGLWRGGGFYGPVSVSTGSTDGSCWVADTGNNEVVHLAIASIGQDTTPPSLSLPADIVVEATSVAGAVVTYTASAIDQTDGILTVIGDPTSGSTFPVGTTTVTCTATDSHGNAVSGTFMVTVQVPPNVVVAAGPDRTILVGGFCTLEGSAFGGEAPYTYAWSPATGLSGATEAQPTASPSETTSYTLTVTDALGQTATSSVTVTVVVASALTATAGPDRTIAEGGSCTLEGSAFGGEAPYTYVWSPAIGLSSSAEAQPTASPLETTTYTLTVTDALGQTATSSVAVTVVPAPTATAGPDRTIAVGAVSILEGNASGGQPPYTYSWSPATALVGATEAQPAASPSETTIYTLTVTDAWGQTATSSVTVTVVASVETVVEAWRGGGRLYQVSVNPADSSCSAVGGDQVVHLGADGAELWRGGSFLCPQSVVVNPNDGSCWVADTGNGQVVHLGADGAELWRGGGFLCPTSVSANPSDNSCWVADSSNHQVVHLGADGTELWRGGGFSYPISVSVNPTDGSCWVAGYYSRGQVVHLGADGTELWRGEGFVYPISVSVNPTDGSCWVADYHNSQVVHLGADGTELWRGGGFANPISVSVNPTDGSCWVADYHNSQVVHLGADGAALWRGGGVAQPTSVSVNPADNSCWVADPMNSQAVHLVIVSDGQDTTPPTLALPADIVVEAASAAGAVVTYEASAIDQVDGAVTVIGAPASGSTFPAGTTTVTCAATDSHGNTASGTFMVTVTVPSTVVVAAGPDRTILVGCSCTLEGSAIGGQSPYTYAWSPTAGLSSATEAQPTASPFETTSYTLTVTDALGQTASSYMTMTVVPALTATAGPDRTITVGAFCVLQGSASGGLAPCTYAWSPTTGLSSATEAQPAASPSETTTYALTVTDHWGQTATSTVTVTVVASVETVVEAWRGGGQPYQVSVNQADSSCWAVGNDQVVHLGADGTELWRGGGFCCVQAVSVNSADNSCWIALTATDEVVHLGVDGTELWRGGGFNQPIAVSVDPTDGSCWVAGHRSNQVVHLGADGAELWRGGGFSMPSSVSVNPADGSCWVADPGNNQVVHLAVDGTELWRGGGFLSPRSVSVNPADGSCWVADYGNHQVVHLGADGVELWRGGSFNQPDSVSVNRADGSCWVTDGGRGQVVHLGADGTELWRGGGFSSPRSVSANPTDNSCWVADYMNSQVVHLVITSDGQDTTPPALALPADIVVEATSAEGAVVTYEASAIDQVDGAVTVVSSPASGSTFPIGTTTVTCTATDSHGNVATGTFTVSVTVTTHTLALTGSNGSVIVNGVSHALPWSGSFDHGTDLTLQANPDSHYHFTNWSGDLGGATNPTSLSVDGEKSITVGFGIDQYGLSLTGTHGQVKVNGVSQSLPCDAGNFDYGSVVTLEAVASTGYHFGSWSGDASGTAASTAVTMDGAKSASANFAVNSYMFSVAGSNGSVTVNGTSYALPWSGSFDHGTTVSLVVTPSAHHHFTSWSGDLSGTSASTSLLMDGAKTVTAGIEVDTCAFAVAGTNGQVMVNGVPQSLPFAGTYGWGSTLTLEAVPDSGYVFTHWSGDLAGSDSPASLLLDGEKAVIATFWVRQYQLILTGTDGNVKVNGVSHALPWSGALDYGTVVTLEAVPNSGYHFASWTGDLDGAENPASFILDGDKSIEAGFDNTAVGTEVAVVLDSTWVTFDSVTTAGNTTVTPAELSDPLPSGFEFLGDVYDISTTAEFTGTITVQFHYDDADVPGGGEQSLSLLHWENGHWVDVTVRPIDDANNIITGRVTSLSPFAIAARPQMEGFLQPINMDGSSVFKLKSTIPVKLRLRDAAGNPITNATVRLYVAKVSSSITGTYEEAVATNSPDGGNIFRYDGQQYVFNLGTGGLSTGTWRLKADYGGLVDLQANVSLK